MAAAAGILAGLGGGILQDIIGNEYAKSRQATDQSFQERMLEKQFQLGSQQEMRARKDAELLGIPYPFLSSAQTPTYQTWNGNRFSTPSVIPSHRPLISMTPFAQALSGGAVSRKPTGSSFQKSLQPMTQMPQVRMYAGRTLPPTPVEMDWFNRNGIQSAYEKYPNTMPYAFRRTPQVPGNANLHWHRLN